MYLVNRLKNKAKAHLWKQGDTACRMWTTGGMKQTRDGYEVVTKTERDICQMCRVNGAKA